MGQQRIVFSLLLVALAVLAFAGRSQAQLLTVSMMPSYNQNLTYANAAINESIQVWGRGSGGSGTYTTYTIDFGDGTPVASGSVVNANFPSALSGGANPTPIASPNRNFIAANHAYATGGSKTVTLTVTDSSGATASGTAVIRVLLAPTHDERVNMAIEKGLLYLYRTQVITTAGGGVQVSQWSAANSGEYQFAVAGAAAMCFAENGHLATNDPVTDVYADTVKRCLYYAVYLGRNQTIGAQPSGNPDANGNGQGIYFADRIVYNHSFQIMGVVNAFKTAAAAQATPIPAGLWAGGGIAPANFKDFVQDALDTFAWCQSDGTWKGWYYYTHASFSNPDGSTHQWPTIAILTAQERWGINPPGWVSPASRGWVVDNAMNAFNQLTAPLGAYKGGLGYANNNHWNNQAKTGGSLVGYYLGGKLIGPDADANNTFTFVKNFWTSQTLTWSGAQGGGWLGGDWYPMFALKKGLQLQGVTTLTTPDSVVHDWYKEMSGWLLGNASLLPAGLGSNYRPPAQTAANAKNTYGFGQQDNGSWTATQNYPGSYSGTPMGTAHGILILTKAVTIPLPVAVILPVGDQSSRFPAPFTLDGSTSYHQDTGIPLVEYLWDMDASNGVNFNSPDATGPTPTVNPGWITNGPRTVTLRVKDNQNPALTATATIVINVTANDIAPTALAMPPTQVPQIYTGNLDDTIVLDGSASFDVDGDVIEKYEWDLNGDGQYGTAADIALDTSGNLAVGSTASVIYTSPNNSQVGLKVYSTPRNEDGIALGPQLSGVSTKPIDVYASVTDLYVSSLTVANLVPTVSADVSATLTSAAGSAAANNVVVRFYNGDPLAGGVQIGGSYPVNIPAGGSVGLNLPGFALGGATTLWAFVDANNLVVEYNEANNTDSVNVSNQPPEAFAQDVTVFADANCQGIVTVNQINDNSSDPDGDGITITVAPVGPYSIGFTLVTLTVSDGKESSSDQATVTVQDTTPPTVVSCPAEEVIECPALVDFGTPEFADNCCDHLAITFLDENLPVAGKEVTKTKRTWTATDDAFLKVSCSQTITVEDNTAPTVVSCPAGELIECPTPVVFGTPVFADTCDTDLTVTFVDADQALAGQEVSKTTRTWTATDDHGNSITCSQTITAQDTTDPVITYCPDDVCIVSDAGSCDATNVDIGALLATDACDQNLVITNDHPLTTYPVGTTTVTWTVTDHTDNSVSCTQDVTVLASVAVTWRPPLTHQPVKNAIKVGQVVPHKVLLKDCTGVTMVSGVTVTLRIQGIDGVTGDVIEEVPEDAQGVGVDGTVTSDGIMVLTDSQWHFNVDTGNFGDTNTFASDNYYESTVTVTDNATLKVLGTSSVILETKSRGK